MSRGAFDLVDRSSLVHRSVDKRFWQLAVIIGPSGRSITSLCIGDVLKFHRTAKSIVHEGGNIRDVPVLSHFVEGDQLLLKESHFGLRTLLRWSDRR